MKLRANALSSCVLALLVVASCGGKSRRTIVPKVPTHGDVDARHRFQSAQQQFERDGVTGADGQKQTAEFEAIAEAYPNDPVAPYALLYAGIAASRAGEHSRAVDSLSKLATTANVDRGVLTRGKLFHGIALVYLGDHAAAAAMLSGTEAAIENDGERAEWHAAMAESLSHTGAAMSSLAHYDGWYRKATRSEKSYIISRLRELVDQASPADVRAAYDGLRDRKAPSAAYLGLAVSSALQARGDSAGADRVRDQTRAARQLVGIETPGSGEVAGDTKVIGAVLPLSGKRGPIGELAARGLTMAAGAVGESRGVGVEVAVRDSASGAAADAVDGLAAQGAVTLVGPIAGASVASVSQRASRAGVPMISLDPRPRASAPGILFHITHSAEARARALARWSYARGVRDYAILAPKSGYGRAVSKAFADEVVSLGGSIVVRQEYDAGETSFTKVVKKLRKPWRAIFVPERAARLALIAPALAAGNMVSSPVDAKPSKRGRTILLLSTAEGLDARYLRSAGRYSRGAVLAPGFYPDRFDPVIGPFTERYEDAYGRLPGVWEAHAHDAAKVVSRAAATGARSRRAMSSAIGGVRVPGLTGDVRFGADGRRADEGLLFTVQPRSSDYVIRALRD